MGYYDLRGKALRGVALAGMLTVGYTILGVMVIYGHLRTRGRK